MRNIFNINETWYFSKEAACAPSALPADWEAVQLPHTWNAADGQDGGADYHRGTCWYAKKLKKSEFSVDFPGKCGIINCGPIWRHSSAG